MAQATCIYCEAPTGSREHTFPAALGGRRFNKGILCGRCNRTFATLDATLSRQLDSISGLLGVRPDHSNVRRKAVGVEASTKRPVVMKVDGWPEGQPHALREWTEDGKNRVVMEFSSHEDLQRWVQDQRRRGIKCVEYSRQEGRRFSLTGVDLPLTLGGLDAMREIGRIGLNFLAHYFPKEARSPGLAAFKQYVIAGADERLVHFEFSPELEEAMTPSSPFAHRVLVALDVDRAEAYARISLFSTFDFSVHFGRVRVASTACVLTEIDPLQERPNDVRIEYFSRPIARPALRLSEEEQASAAETRVRRFFVALRTRQWELGTSALLVEINNTRGIPSPERYRVVCDLLDRESQRMLLLARTCTEPFRRTPPDAPEPAQAVAAVASALVQEDHDRIAGIAEGTEAFMHAVRFAVAKHVCVALDRGPLSAAELRDYLEGRSGVQIAAGVFEELVQCAMYGSQ